MDTIFRSRDGLEFSRRSDAEAHERKLDGLIYCCPSCAGSGTASEFSHNKTRLGVFGSEYEEKVYRTVPCKTCNGKPYEKHPWIPVTETVVVGYKRGTP